MPRDNSGGHGKSKSELITDVLTEDPGRPTPKVQAAVWERFGEAVTAREIAQARRKLRASAAPPNSGPPQPAPAAARVKKARPPAPLEPESAPAVKPRRRAVTRPAPAGDFAKAEVTVAQLSAILDVAGEVGGLGRLRDAVRAVARLRERVGAVDDRQLGFALDFLASVTGKR